LGVVLAAFGTGVYFIKNRQKDKQMRFTVLIKILKYFSLKKPVFGFGELF